MPTIDYSKTVIYQLTCPTFEGIYVSYTTNLRVKKSKYSRPDLNNPLEFQDTIDLHGGFKKWKLIILENFSECKIKKDAMQKVEEWITIITPSQLKLPSEKYDMKTEIEMLRKEIAKKDRELVIAKIDNEIIKKTEELAKKTEELAKKTEELAKIDEELAKKTEDLKSITNDTSLFFYV